jgi:diguanylate cyclase (GGDEF)-like protein/PAS domain S-box-containing protein
VRDAPRAALDFPPESPHTWTVKVPSRPVNEAARQRALEQTGLLDTRPDAEFDDITALVAAHLGVPICLVSLVDRDRQWFKSRHGLDANETPRDVSFCGHVVVESAPLVVEDATTDARFADNPLVCGPPNVRAYAGMPLATTTGLVLGTLCAIDNRPRAFAQGDLDFLRRAARLVMDAIRRRTLAHIKDDELRGALDLANAAALFVDEAGHVVWCARRAARLLGIDHGEASGRPPLPSLFADPGPIDEAVRAALFEERSSHNIGARAARAGNGTRALLIDIDPHPGPGPLDYARCRITDPSEADDRDARLQRYSALFEASPELLATLDGRGHPDQINPSWERTLGWTADELRAHPLADLAHPEDAALLRALFDAPAPDGPVATPPGIRLRARNGSYRLLAPSVSIAGGPSSFSARDITAQAAGEKRISFQDQLNKELSELQRAYIENAGAGAEWWERALALLIRLTGSEYGFIGSIQEDETGRFLRTHAITNIAWDEETRRLYEASRTNGMEFRNLDTLFGRVIAEGRTLVSNDVANDPRAHGRPSGHPPLRHFLGLACGQSKQMVGMVGLANRPSGYDPGIVADLEAAGVVLAAVIHQSLSEARRARVESRLQGIVDSTLDVIITIDRQGIVESVNPAIRAVFGYEPSECIGRNVSMLMNQTDRARHDGYLQRYLETGEIHIIGNRREVVGLRKDGQEVNIELTVWTNAAEPGQSFNGLMRDVTARVRTEKQLRDAAAQLSGALALAKAGHWELDLETDLFTFNDELYKIFGIEAAQVGGYRLSTGEYASRFVHPEDVAIIRREVGKALSSTAPSYARDLEHRFLDASGQVGYLAVGIRGTRDADGALRKLYGVVQDVTARREREQERQRMLEQSRAARELADRVAELDRAREASGLLTECVTFLQRAISAPEGIDLISRYLAQMYPQANVAVYAIAPDMEELVLHTGMKRFGDASAPETMESTDCWALRSRGVYATYEGSSHVPCRHCADQDHGMVLCAPITGADRTIGLVTIAFARAQPDDEAPDGNGRIIREVSRFETVVQSLSGAMSTILLRESLQRLALTDEGTGLPNRRAFMRAAMRMAGRARRAKETIVVALLDVDRFKSINDEFGHDEGDRVLRRLSEIATAAFRQEDLVGRLGGEEFGIVLVGAEGGVRERLEFLRATIESASILRARPVTVSIGYAVATPVDPQPLEVLLKAADTALYDAKNGGRNRVMPETTTPPA